MAGSRVLSDKSVSVVAVNEKRVTAGIRRDVGDRGRVDKVFQQDVSGKHGGDPGAVKGNQKLIIRRLHDALRYSAQAGGGTTRAKDHCNPAAMKILECGAV